MIDGMRMAMKTTMEQTRVAGRLTMRLKGKMSSKRRTYSGLAPCFVSGPPASAISVVVLMSDDEAQKVLHPPSLEEEHSHQSHAEPGLAHVQHAQQHVGLSSRKLW